MLLPDSLMQDLRNTLFSDRGHTPAPKSRKLIIREQHWRMPLGWMLVHQVENG
jgi:hypothetical protein